MPNVPQIPPFDLSVLPDTYRRNWHIYLSLRSGAQVRYATAFADAVASKVTATKRSWCEAFDQAAIAWLEAHPTDPVWQGPWPDNADVYLGSAALDDARRLMGWD